MKKNQRFFIPRKAEVLQGKRGVSELIATVMLILVTITAAGIIYSVVMPMIKGNIESTQKCNGIGMEVMQEEGYTCYDAVAKEVKIEVNRAGDSGDELSGIQLLVYGEGRTLSRTIRANDTIYPDIKEYYRADYLSNLSLPAKNEARTYVISIATSGMASVESVNAIPIIKISNKEKICSAGSRTPISAC